MKFIILLVTLLTASLAFGQEEDVPINENPVSAQFHLENSKIPAGGQAKINIDVTVAKDHHAYKDMIKLYWVGDEGVFIDSIDIIPVHQFEDPATKKVREGVESQGTVSAILHIPAQLAQGPHQGKLSFGYQACSARYCLFPKTINYDVAFTVATATLDSPSGGNEFEKALAKGKFWAFLFVFIGGFLTSLTPCVFPMIPITISIIGARSATNKRSRSFALSVSYVLGIGLTYASMGVLAASTGAFFGSALSNIWVVLGIAVTFVVMGLSMLGAFELQVPAGIRNRFGNASTGTGLPGAFFAGLFAGIVASPCIGPVLVSILAYVAQTAQVVFGFFLLFTFAMGMGILFIAMGTFSGLLTKIPRAGPWMETIKIVFGYTFIAMAFYYMYPILPRSIFHGLTAMTLLLTGFHYGAFKPALNSKLLLKKSAMLATFFGGVILLATVVLNGLSIDLNAKLGREPNGNISDGLKWTPYTEELIAKSAKEKRPVIIDFSAQWCVACHELDSFTFTDPKVKDQSSAFTLLNINATESTPEIKELQKKYSVLGLPTIIFIDTSGNVMSGLTVTGFVKADSFLDRMKKAL